MFRPVTAVAVYAGLLSVILTQSIMASADEVTCFAPDGQTLGDNETYVPCNKLGITQDGVFSMCCALDGPVDERDLCTSTGLCLRGSVLSRAYCTDENWQSDACVKVCMDEESGGSANGTVEITPCSDGTYCCGHNNLNCCGTDSAFKIPSLVNIETDTDKSDGSGAFKSATIALAVILGVVALVALITIWALRRKNKALYHQLSQTPPSPPAPTIDQQQHMAQTPTMGAYSTGTFHQGSPHQGSMGSPLAYIDYNQHYKGGSPVPPTSPGISEAPTTQRYSELDGGSGTFATPPAHTTTFPNAVHEQDESRRAD